MTSSDDDFAVPTSSSSLLKRPSSSHANECTSSANRHKRVRSMQEPPLAPAKSHNHHGEHTENSQEVSRFEDEDPNLVCSLQDVLTSTESPRRLDITSPSSVITFQQQAKLNASFSSSFASTSSSSSSSLAPSSSSLSNSLPSIYPSQVISSEERHCPICCLNLTSFDLPASESHVNRCLDDPTPASPVDAPHPLQTQRRNQIATWATILSGRPASTPQRGSMGTSLKARKSAAPSLSTCSDVRTRIVAKASSRVASVNPGVRKDAWDVGKGDKFVGASEAFMESIKDDTMPNNREDDNRDALDSGLQSTEKSCQQDVVMETKNDIDQGNEIETEHGLIEVHYSASNPPALPQDDSFAYDFMAIDPNDIENEPGIDQVSENDDPDVTADDVFENAEDFGEDHNPLPANDEPNMTPADNDDDDEFANINFPLLTQDSTSLAKFIIGGGAEAVVAVRGKGKGKGKAVKKRGGRGTGDGAIVAPRPKKACPWYKWIPGTKYTMDAFMFGKVEGCEAYFLSHFHSDHYGGLGAKFDHGPIYCSQVTANLVAHQLRVKPEFINPLPMETRIDIGGVGVTLIDANHCPGAAIFVFDVPNEGQSPSSTLHLHTGDFRADAVIHLRHPLIASIPRFSTLFLDTTYCNPSFTFPPQSEVISAICQLARGVCVQGRSVEDIVSGCWDVEGAKWNEGKGVNGGHIAAAALMRNWIGKGKNEEGVVGAAKTVVQSFVDRFRKKKGTLVVVGTYLIGKEKVFKAIAQCLNTKVFADASKRRILKLLQDPELDALITSNPQEAGVYVIGLGKINRESLTEVLQGAQDRFDKIIGIRPTGWTYRAPKTGNKAFKVTSLKPNAVSSQICVVGVPYSEHSSYEELKMFVTGVGVDKVIPTVNVAKHEEMGKLFGRWKNGEE